MRFPAAIVGTLSLLAPLALAQHPHAPESGPQSNAALEQFKTLSGEWDGKDNHGKPVHASYETLASGVVMERVQAEGEPSMVTMYSLDGDHIVAIHFCSAGNQPILRTGTVSAATGKYAFQVERTYGLRSPDELHMVELLFTLPDADHVTEAWTNLDHGKKSTNTVSLTRKK